MDKCAKCGKGMSSPNGTRIIGMDINYPVAPSASQEYKEFAQKQTGKFEINHNYHICFECYLSALGIQPEQKNESAPKRCMYCAGAESLFFYSDCIWCKNCGSLMEMLSVGDWKLYTRGGIRD